MSANDDASFREIPDRAETETPEPGATARNVTPAPRGYQKLFRAVCLKNSKPPADPA